MYIYIYTYIHTHIDMSTLPNLPTDQERPLEVAAPAAGDGAGKLYYTIIYYTIPYPKIYCNIIQHIIK